MSSLKTTNLVSTQFSAPLKDYFLPTISFVSNKLQQLPLEIFDGLYATENERIRHHQALPRYHDTDSP
jgi:hypothetical protein